MPFVHFIVGKSATIITKDGKNLSKEITNLDSYKNLSSECGRQGLTLFDTVNARDRKLAFFVGLELYDDQHIYRGLTLTLNQDVTPEQKAATITQFDKLMVLLQEAGFNPDVEQGLVVSQFD